MVGLMDPFRRREELEEILAAAIANIYTNDWFSRNDDIRLGGIPGLLSYTTRERGIEDVLVDDAIRRHNLVIQLTNSLVDPRAENAQVHPKIIDRGVDRGKYPIQFLIPMRIGDLDRLDALTIDRILDAYSLPLNPGGLGFTGRLDHLRTGILSVGGPSDRISMSGPGDQIRARLRAQERGLGLGSSRDARLQALLEFLGVNLSWRDREPYGVRPYGLLGRNS